MAILNLTKIKQVSTKQQQGPSRKRLRTISTRRVHFNESQNQSYANKDRTAEECRATWYSKQEFIHIRADVTASIQKLKQRQEEQQKSGDLSFQDIQQALFDVVASVDYVVEDPMSIMTSEVKKMMSLLYKYSDHGDECSSLDLIGLELYVDGRARCDVKERRESIQEVVYDVQNEYKAGLLSDPQAYEVELRDSCFNFSQASGLFAMLKAHARLV
ncbi:hypothetical protein ACA910_019798 [Epithemia clementina (nom. ined.)]